MKFTKRDYEGARRKLAKAGLTERQLDALADLILSEAVRQGEHEACSENGRVTKRLGGVGSLVNHRTGRDAVRVAVYWFHRASHHLVNLPENMHYDAPEHVSTWRPKT